jgi:hypothetical protein
MSNPNSLKTVQDSQSLRKKNYIQSYPFFNCNFCPTTVRPIKNTELILAYRPIYTESHSFSMSFQQNVTVEHRTWGTTTKIHCQGRVVGTPSSSRGPVLKSRSGGQLP